MVLETMIMLPRYEAGCELGGRRELDQLEILRTIDLVMHDTRGLQAAVAGAESELSLILVSEGNPPPQDIKHLKVEFMDVRSCMRKDSYRFFDPNDMSIKHAAGCLVDAEISVFEKCSKSWLPAGIFREAGRELLIFLLHRMMSPYI